MSDEGEIRWYWGVAFLLSLGGMLIGGFGWSDMKEAKELRDHYEICASVAETIEGFRACTNHER